jgi:S1-C subfamily serine protease
MLLGLAASAALCLTVAACVTTGTSVPIASAPVATPRVIPAGAEAKPIQFRRVVVRLNRGTRIGSISGGYLCIPHGDLTWKSGGRVLINDDEFTDVFREELSKANYPVVGDPKALFEDASEWRAELLVAGLVTELQLNVCMPPGNSAKGEAGLTVEWQVFSRLDRKVVHKVTTKGTARLSDFTTNGANVVLHNAFAQATRALLADEGFFQLVSQGVIGAQPDIREADFRLSPRAPLSGPITTRIAEVQGGVVTVFAGPGQGSGFFISGDGYVLTNAHVVREAKFVKLKLATGREILGEVVATNAARDVGLIKTQESGFTPLALGTGELPIGNDVYAIGSPFTERLASTVTRGIISAYRNEDGMRLIQSDVSVQPGNSGGPLTDASGNVVGITMKGLAVRGAMAGLNFFVPIDEALRSVGVERMEAARGSSRMARIDRPAAPRVAPPPQVASATPQVAALPPPPPKIDGDYRATVPANTLAGIGPFEMYISVRSGLITGHGQPSGTRGNALCRAAGSIASDGDAVIDITCGSGGFTQTNIRATGRFEPEPSTNEVVGRTRYSFATGATGELTWQK